MGERAAVYGRQSRNSAKSISEQLQAGHGVVAAEGWEHVADYKDGSSASRYATKPRGGWAQVLGDVQGEVFDVLVLWESSRGDRTPESWFAFLSSCRNHKVRIHVVTHDRTYDLTNARDWKTLAEDGVNNAYETELLSIRTKRGHAGAAAAGLPPGGPTPYGYRRTFDPRTGKRLGQEIFDPEATIVREIFQRISECQTILGISNDLNAREIKPPASEQWGTSAVRRIGRNPVYVALRVHNGTEHKGTWDPIVSESVFYAVQRVLSEPGRRITRPGRQLHLLTYLARCGVCGSWIDQARGKYRCAAKGCVGSSKPELDAAVTEMVIRRLTRPDVIEELSRPEDHDVTRAHTEAEKLRLRLDEFRLSAARGETSPASLAVIENDLAGRIADLQKQARQAALPTALRDMLDPETDVRERWNAATLIARRAVINSLCEIRVGKGRPGRSTAAQARERAYERLSGSRWHGDDKTWGDYSAT